MKPLLRKPSAPGLLRRLAVALFGALAAAGPLDAAKAEKSPGESGPVLMSRTGGAGGGWADLKELEAAAAKGNPRAEAQLGEMLLRGEGVAKHEARAVALLEKAARAGHSGAAFRTGMLLMEGQAGLAADPERALAYFRAAAAGGEAEAFFNIGAAYGSGRGVKRSYAEALGWLIVARQRGAGGNAEADLRARIKTYPSWIATGERRAKEIAAEFAGKKVADYLPPDAKEAAAKQAAAAKAPDALRPAGELSPAEPTLRPALPRESLAPPLPALPGLPPLAPPTPPR